MHYNNTDESDEYWEDYLDDFYRRADRYESRRQLREALGWLAAAVVAALIFYFTQ